MIGRLKQFGLFWWGFLVGDAWELAVSGIIVLGLAYALRHSPLVAAVIVPASIVALLNLSAWMGRKRSSGV